MEQYICIHGHFYQPPRENPWLEDIEIQDSAHPYHNWNARITEECYAPNTASRILDSEGWIVKIVNNYSKISFDLGPTLLAWMEKNSPEVYQAILEADRVSSEMFGGHGSAMAQAYNHMILPLANHRDKYAQILWGILDFTHRFGRKPEGMWLPETGVDLESLDIMADMGVRFTILAPHQAQQVRKIGDRNWQDVSGGRIDTSLTYKLRLPSGRMIALFFYDSPISHAVAFEDLLKNGESFADRLLNGFSYAHRRPQLVHIATDGETYGHHHRFGEMALAYALHHIDSNNLARITNYGEYLERHPPTHEVEILENTSWSCSHGVERWRSNCGCNTGSNPEWNQSWRAPLREALDWLRDTLAPRFEEKGRQYLKNLWAARNDYINLVLDRSRKRTEQFLNQHTHRELNEAEKIIVLKLLELQRHAMLMFSSCGWFFDELSGIETVQILRYAGRAIDLAEDVFGEELEGPFLTRLERAKSNIPEQNDGRHIYETFVKPSKVDPFKVGAHYAVSSVFEEHARRDSIYCYKAYRENYQIMEAGKAKLAVGRVRITSEITHESLLLCFGVLHFGDHNLEGGVHEFHDETAAETMLAEVSEAFTRADFPETIRALDRHFGAHAYSLKSLFRDDQRKILNSILEATLSKTDSVYRELYENHAPLIRFLTDLKVPVPKGLHAAAECFLNIDLRQAINGENLDLDRITTLLEEARDGEIAIDAASLSYELQHNLVRMMKRLKDNPTDLNLLRSLEAAMGLVSSLPFDIDLRMVQNIYYVMSQSIYPKLRKKAERGKDSLQEWVNLFRSLGEKLRIRVE